VLALYFLPAAVLRILLRLCRGQEEKGSKIRYYCIREGREFSWNGNLKMAFAGSAKGGNEPKTGWHPEQFPVLVPELVEGNG
jgi:hypothetical protein